jgi:hypothetical protein
MFFYPCHIMQGKYKAELLTVLMIDGLQREFGP